MLKFKIEVMSCLEAFQYVYTYSGTKTEPNFAIISIQDEPQSRLGFQYKVAGKLKAALNIHFLDLDNPEKCPDLRYFTENDANVIKNFVELLIEENNIEKLIIHCTAGVSRSSAVAAALLKVYNDDDSQIFESGDYAPNMHVYKTLLKVYGMENNGSTFLSEDFNNEVIF